MRFKTIAHLTITNFAAILFLFVLLNSPEATFGIDNVCTRANRLNIVLIADAFLDENALRNFELSKTMKNRPGKWRFTRVRSEQDIQNALSTEKNECINTLIVAGLHTGWDDGHLKASVRYGEGRHLI